MTRRLLLSIVLIMLAVSAATLFAAACFDADPWSGDARGVTFKDTGVVTGAHRLFPRGLGIYPRPLFLL